MNEIPSLPQASHRQFLFGALVGALAAFAVAIVVAMYVVPPIQVSMMQSVGSMSPAVLAASPLALHSDQWYLETQPQPAQHDQWYLEMQPQPAQRDQWYLGTQAQSARMDTSGAVGESFVMAGAREHYFQMKVRPAH